MPPLTPHDAGNQCIEMNVYEIQTTYRVMISDTGTQQEALLAVLYNLPGLLYLKDMASDALLLDCRPKPPQELLSRRLNTRSHFPGPAVNTS